MTQPWWPTDQVSTRRKRSRTRGGKIGAAMSARKRIYKKWLKDAEKKAQRDQVQPQ